MATSVRPLAKPIKPIPSEEKKKELAVKLLRKRIREQPLASSLGEKLRIALTRKK